jgi:hypothetical protein
MLPLSFSVETASAAVRRFLVVFGIIGFLLPVIILGWWVYGGGQELDRFRQVQTLGGKDPHVEAEQAIQAGNYWLYTTGSLLDQHVPGIRSTPNDAYRRVFGYQYFALITNPDMTPDADELNEAALAFMREYNTKVYAEVHRLFPNWRQEYEQQRHR